MAQPDQSTDTRSRNRLPTASCQFAVALLIVLASVCFLVGWRVHREMARLGYFEQLGGSVETEPASPVWRHDLAVARLSADQAAGFTQVRANLRCTATARHHN